MSYDALDDFAGPGGWDEGARMVGLATVGIEWDMAACQTAKTAGHTRIRADVSAYPSEPFAGIPGYIASPPCQAWSMAGKRKGERDRANCHVLADRMARGNDSTDWTEWEDPRSALVCQPVRRVRDLRPEWVALEEVPAVLGLWQHFARIFRGWGYAVWVGTVCTADYGVPQERYRSILMASRLVTRVMPPAPTHSHDGGTSDLFGDHRQPWVTMEQAIGWGFTDRPSITVVCGNNGGGADPLSGGSGGRAAIQQAADVGRWTHKPGTRPLRGPGRAATCAEVGVLQSFPADYPWQGDTLKTKLRQVGNAVPPLLAAHVLAALTGKALEVAA